jgi:hypothetical protein
MKLPIIPIVVALLAGIGGGTGYAFMSSAPAEAVAAHADSAHADSAHADSAHGEGTHGAGAKDAGEPAGVHGDSVTGAVSDSMHQALHPANLPAGAASQEPSLPLTPADSIRAELAARAGIKSESKAGRSAAGVKSPAAAPATGTASHDAPANVSTGSGTKALAAMSARMPTIAPPAALPEQRLAKIFGAMQAKDAGKVLEQMTDSDIRTVLGMMSDRQAAAILSTLSPPRAAAITKGIVRGAGGTP